MNSAGVIDLYILLHALGIETWIDGGGRVDALLGEQTRPHGDLDIVIPQKDVPRLRELLEAQGFKNLEREDTSPRNFVLARIH